jgi:bleomycin hydrolase
MKPNNWKGASIFALACMISSPVAAQEGPQEKEQEYQFTIEKRVPATPVKDQHRSGTCWSFGTTSFIESELLRTGKGTFDLSEMYFVRQAYPEKAEKYVRMHGKSNFGEGGLTHDVINTWRRDGIVPQEAYDGLQTGDSLPVHNEMDAVLKGYIEQVIKNPNRTLTPVWMEGFEGILDAYLGKVPENFVYEGRTYTPRSFADHLGLDPDDYVMIGSFTHHPFYEDFIIEIPDNWSWGTIKNVPLDEMMEVLEHALEQGYSVCWDADISEKGFDRKTDVARIPPEDMEGETVTQEMRQQAFDNYRTTDDHLMHITGLARDQLGNRFYLVKNSWGTDNRIYKGYLYVSEAYVRAKTLFLVVHRDAVPSDIAGKLGL